MKKITYEQNGIRHEMSTDTMTLAPSLLWDLATSKEFSKPQREIFGELHGLVCALNFGKVEVRS
jgi:hypothetical protein